MGVVVDISHDPLEIPDWFLPVVIALLGCFHLWLKELNLLSVLLLMDGRGMRTS